MLNSLGRFAAAAATPILLNLAMIAPLLALTPLHPDGRATPWPGASPPPACSSSSGWLLCLRPGGDAGSACRGRG